MKSKFKEKDLENFYVFSNIFILIELTDSKMKILGYIRLCGVSLKFLCNDAAPICGLFRLSVTCVTSVKTSVGPTGRRHF